MIEYKTNEEYLKRLAMILDNERHSYLHARMEEDHTIVNYLEDSMKATVGYFLRLTVKALDDRELAERLVKIYREIYHNSIFIGEIFGLLMALLKTRHEFKGCVPVKVVKERIRTYEGEEGMLEIIPDVYAKLVEHVSAGLGEEEEKRENVMFW